MSITLTERAANHVQNYMTPAPEDQTFESYGVKVFVDPKSLVYIDGTELDFVREGLNEGFKFNNPQEKDKCGCGESFNV